MYLFDSFADRYDYLRTGDPPYIPIILEQIRRFGNRCILDLGCGTGKVAEKILEVVDVRFLGVDISPKMLYKFASKNTPAELICASAENLPFISGIADGIICIYLLHLLENPQDTLKSLRYVLNSGWILIVSAPHHFIKTHPLNKFFPSFMKIDLARFPSDTDIVKFLKDAGFNDIEVQYCSVFRKWYSFEYLEKVKSKFISTLSLLTEEEFRAGIKRMEEFIRSGKNLESQPWESLVIIGYV